MIIKAFKAFFIAPNIDEGKSTWEKVKQTPIKK